MTDIGYLAVALMTVVGVFGLVFAAGSAFSDLETAQAVGTTAPWLVLAVALSAFAFWSHRIAPWALGVLTAFTVVVASLVDADRGGAGLGELLTASSGAAIVPVLVVAALLLTADALDHGRDRSRHPGAVPAR